MHRACAAGEWSDPITITSGPIALIIAEEIETGVPSTSALIVSVWKLELGMPTSTKSMDDGWFVNVRFN